MAKPGPKPKPLNLRVMEGDHHKSRYNTNEPQHPSFSDPPAPPEWMDGLAAEFWTWAARLLVNARILTEADTALLAALCVAYARWREDPSTNKTKTYTSLLCEFGMSPSSRTRLVVSTPHEEADPITRRLSGMG